MKTSVAFALAAAKLIAAHTTFQSIVVDGKDQGQHYAVQTPSNGNNPILDTSSSSLVCNGGSAITGEFVKIAAGSKIGLQWHHNDPMTTSGDSDEPIASSHHGPVMVYMAKAEGNGEGAVWTKIYEDGLTNGVWGVDNFISNKGLIEVTLPDLEDGNYLIRPEMIALHEGNREGGAQFYNGCGQLTISGGSTALPSSGTDMTKAYTATDPGVLVDIYNGITDYEIPGPAVWDGSSSGSTPTTPSKPSTTSSTPSATATPSTPASTSAPTLPDTFTVDEFITYVQEATAAEGRPRRHVRFIAWLREQVAASSSKTRRHVRDFDF